MLFEIQNIWISRAVAFCWGFLFLLLFRYSLDNIYPFFSHSFSLSFLAFLLLAAVWISFWRHFQGDRKKRTRKILFISFAGVNTAVFLLAISILGEDGYKYRYPVCFTIQIFLHLFIFAAKLPFFIGYRISLIAGFLPGIVPFEIAKDPFFIFFIGALLSIFPDRFLKEEKPKFLKRQVKLLPFRQSVDFIRFSFLAFSFYGIFDEFRERFYGVFFIIILGSLLQIILLKIEKRRFRLKHGILFFTIFSILSAVLYGILKPHYAAAMSYVVLSFWEEIYFRKATEGYLKREQLIIGLILILICVSHFFNAEWGIITAGVLVCMGLFRVFFFSLKKLKPVFSVLLITGAFAWLGISGLKALKIYKETFWSSYVHEKKEIKPPSVLSLLYLPSGKTLYTDIFPEEALEQFSKDPVYFKAIHYKRIQAILFSTHTFAGEHKNENNKVFIFSLSNLRPYGEKDGYHNINLFFNDKEINNVYFYDVDEENKIFFTNRIFDGQNKFTSNQPALSESQRVFLDVFSTILGEYYEKKSDFSAAYNIYIEMLPYFNESPRLYRKIASVCGSLGKVAEQISYLEKYILLQKEDSIQEKRFLLELYFLTGNKQSVEELAEQLIFEDKQNEIDYLRWLFKLSIDEKNQFKWMRLYYRVKNTDVPEGSALYAEKETLLKEIEDIRKENPHIRELYNEELKRQETIQFPD
ncbi:MAG: hypothetical protein OEZ13_02435 [Spirochaetia bacterium]|nr:hypothetical protein [Spirochaetia bacterium]